MDGETPLTAFYQWKWHAFVRLALIMSSVTTQAVTSWAGAHVDAFCCCNLLLACRLVHYWHLLDWLCSDSACFTPWKHRCVQRNPSTLNGLTLNLWSSGDSCTGWLYTIQTATIKNAKITTVIKGVKKKIKEVARTRNLWGHAVREIKTSKGTCIGNYSWVTCLGAV